jgi:heme/copper-type cytochrome/quinol oxidase subunit 2
MHFSGPVAAIYFVILNLVGTYIILNLFIAILLSNFDSIEAVDPGSVDPKVRRLTMMVRVRRWLWCFRFFSLTHRSHSISFTRAQGIPKYKIGFESGKGWESWGKIG